MTEPKKREQITNMSKLGNQTFLTNAFENQMILEFVAARLVFMVFSS